MSAGGAGRRVLVIGGGLAGITAALDCAGAGACVTLVEVRRRLGGAAYSFQRDGLEMDNGQHVFLRCCRAYRALLRQLGSEHLVSLQPRLEIPVLSPGRGPARLRRSPLPAPLHLAGALARYPLLSRRQRLGAARAGIALLCLSRSRPARAGELDRESLGDWLARHGQGPRALAALWDLVALPSLNLPAAEASLELGAFVFRQGLLSSAGAGDIGFHRGTLSQIIAGPAARALREAGVEVRLGWRAEELTRSAGGFEIRGRAGRPEEATLGEQRTGQARESIAGEAVIVALPHVRAARLLEPLLADSARRWERLGSSPIVNLHVVYDRPVLDTHFAAGVDTPVQYVFDRSSVPGVPPGCQYLAVSLSGAVREMSMSVDALREAYLPALRELLPRARSARVESFLATREHSATFRAAPGQAGLRPAPVSSVPGLLLAGAWTATGWPATLEGAVLSGHAAARGALQALGMEQPPGAGGRRAPARGEERNGLGRAA